MGHKSSPIVRIPWKLKRAPLRAGTSSGTSVLHAFSLERGKGRKSGLQKPWCEGRRRSIPSLNMRFDIKPAISRCRWNKVTFFTTCACGGTQREPSCIVSCAHMTRLIIYNNCYIELYKMQLRWEIYVCVNLWTDVSIGSHLYADCSILMVPRQISRLKLRLTLMKFDIMIMILIEDQDSVMFM